MDKIFTKIFSFSRSCIQFFKILIVFTIMMLILYWIQDLIGISWAWASFMNPVLDLFLEIGAQIAPGSTNLFAAVFEYKFIVAIFLLLLLYAFTNFLKFLVDKNEELYLKTSKAIRKIEEDNLNKSLEKQITNEQIKLKRYQIYVSTSAKGKIAHREFNVNLEEQNKIMLKFLIEKTMCNPIKKDDGFLFEFNNFEKIDSVLNAFNKLIQSKAPLDYTICVQILGENTSKELEQMEVLKSLKILNKIVSFADTAYRYSYNRDQAYTVSQTGLFQKGEKTFEVHEYIQKSKDIELV